jgi:hypothetical protein
MEETSQLNFINHLFPQKHLLVQLNFLLNYMNFPDNILLTAVSITTKDKIMEITISVPTNNFLYVNIYKEQIIGKISRYFYSKYMINVVFIPVF